MGFLMVGWVFVVWNPKLRYPRGAQPETLNPKPWLNVGYLHQKSQEELIEPHLRSR